MTANITFGHERLDVYRRSLAFVSRMEELVHDSTGPVAAGDHLVRAGEGILECIASGNASESVTVKVHRLEIACGSALECAACVDIYHRKSLISALRWREEKIEVQRIVQMLVGLIRSQDREIRESENPWACGSVGPAEVFFDHERLEVYQRALEFVGWADCAARDYRLGRRRSRRLDELSTSIVLNVAEGNGRRAGSDRLPFVDTAYSSAVKGAVLIDLVVAKGEIPEGVADGGKCTLNKIAGMLFGLRGYCERSTAV